MEVELPCEPTQITVDPDQVLLDRNPTNNHWKPRVRWRPTPLYTQLDEVDLTNAYDRWNIIFGPWVYDSTYTDPWYTRSPMAGLRVGAYRTQEFSGGAYVAYRSNDRNVVAGVDALWDHWPVAQTCRSASTSSEPDDVGRRSDRVRTRTGTRSRGVLFERYVIFRAAAFTCRRSSTSRPSRPCRAIRCRNRARRLPERDPFHQQTLAGLHYHMQPVDALLEPGSGLRVGHDATRKVCPCWASTGRSRRFYAQLSFVKTLRDLFGPQRGVAVSPLAGRFAPGGPNVRRRRRSPDEAQVFTLGGGELFRGYDLSQRQGKHGLDRQCRMADSP